MRLSEMKPGMNIVYEGETYKILRMRERPNGTAYMVTMERRDGDNIVEFSTILGEGNWSTNAKSPHPAGAE